MIFLLLYFYGKFEMTKIEIPKRRKSGITISEHSLKFQAIQCPIGMGKCILYSYSFQAFEKMLRVSFSTDMGANSY